MNCFIIYQFMFLILNELNNENKNENLIKFLTDANPYMRNGETSVDEVVYNDFSNKYSSCSTKDDYAYEFVCNYLKNLDSYYGDIYSIFNNISKDEYIDTCKNILENHSDILKNN